MSSSNTSQNVSVALEPLLRPLRQQNEIVLTGGGRHLGMPVSWHMCFKGDGAFIGEMVTAHLKQRMGHSGEEGTCCWEVDDTGLARQLDLDDHEVVLMGAFVRSGLWLQPLVRAQLVLEPIPMEAVAAAVDLTEVFATDADTDRRAGPSASTSAPSSSAALPFDPARFVCLGLQLRGRKALAQIVIDRATWHPRAVLMPLCGEVEVWKFEPWSLAPSDAPRTPAVCYPLRTLHWAATGGVNSYELTSASVRPIADPSFIAESYQMPFAPLLPEDSEFDPSEGYTCKGYRTSSGHVLVRPSIDGKEIGYMMLDTGASGMVIERSAADKLKLHAFGEIFVSGVAGKVQSTFRQAGDIRIGPLRVLRPVFMEMSVQGLVRGAPGPVIGIVGYDIFRRCIMDIPGAREYQDAATLAAAPATVHWALGLGGRRGDGGKAAAAARAEEPPPIPFFAPRSPRSLVRSLTSVPYDEISIGMFPPGFPVDRDDPELALSWRKIRWVSLLPHIMSQMTLPNADQCYGLFMIDLGAGGTEVMFSAATVRELGLDRPNAPFGSGADSFREIRGIGGDAAPSMRVRSVQVPSITISGASFLRVSCLCVTEGSFDLSLYLAGVVCGDLISKTRMVIDYASSRIAFVPYAAGPGAGSDREGRGGAGNKGQGFWGAGGSLFGRSAAWSAASAADSDSSSSGAAAAAAAASSASSPSTSGLPPKEDFTNAGVLLTSEGGAPPESFFAPAPPAPVPPALQQRIEGAALRRPPAGDRPLTGDGADALDDVIAASAGTAGTAGAAAALPKEEQFKGAADQKASDCESEGADIDRDAQNTVVRMNMIG